MVLEVVEPCFEVPSLVDPLVLKAIKGVKPADAHKAEGRPERRNHIHDRRLHEEDHKQDHAVDLVGHLFHNPTNAVNCS